MDPLRAGADLADTPLGPIRVLASSAGVVALVFEGLNDLEDDGVTPRPNSPSAVSQEADPAVAEDAPAAAAIAADAAAQVRAYLAGERDTIDAPVDWTVLEPFQADVLRLVVAIPAGETRTYGQLAAALGRPGGARAVGRANAMNPMPLVLPCHRVVAADGGMGGYSGPGGVETKAWLLRREGAALL
jgi:methylated-DNA-[protein]-cysteine S-methyltransferase